jgi:hypothetical protein
MHAANPSTDGDHEKLNPIPVIGSARTRISCPQRPRVAFRLARTASPKTAATAMTGHVDRSDPRRRPTALSAPTNGMTARPRRRGGRPNAAAGTTPIPKATANDRSKGATAIAGTAKRSPRLNRDHRQLRPACSSTLSTSALLPPACRSTRPPPLTRDSWPPHLCGASLETSSSERQGASLTSPW